MPAQPSRRRRSFEKGKDTTGLRCLIQKLKESMGILGKGYRMDSALIQRLPDITEGLAGVEVVLLVW